MRNLALFFIITSYADSPEIIRSFLQKESNLILCDLHSAEVEKLKEIYKHVENIHVHKRDCYEAVRALTPPLPFGALPYLISATKLIRTIPEICRYPRRSNRLED